MDKDNTKKQRPPKAVYHEYIYAPSLQNMSAAAVVFGYFFRMVVIAAGVFGMLLFICDAFRIPVDTGLLACMAAVPVVWFCVMSLSKLCFALGGVALLGAIGAVLGLSGDPAAFLLNALGSLWNHILSRIEAAGYHMLNGATFPVEPDVRLSETLTQLSILRAVAILAVVFAAIFTVCLIRRTRIFPLLLTGAVVCTVIFTYNISSSNWGFALLIAFLCGVLPMKIYDGLYFNKRQDAPPHINRGKNGVKRTAVGGFAGFAAMALAMLVLWGPAASVRKQWVTIDFINDRMELGRAIVSSYIIGDVPNIDMGYLGNMDTMNARSTVAEERLFTGKEILRVHANNGHPLYLRSWVASGYSGNSWNTASQSKVDQYKALFGEAFTPEIITANYYELLDPKITNINSFSTYGNHMEYGFVSETIDIETLSSSGNLLFTASSYNPEYGIMNFLSSDRLDQYEGEWQHYYEGILMTSWFNFNKNYRMTAFVPTYRHEDFEAFFNNNRQYYMLMGFYIAQAESTAMTEEDEERLVRAALSALHDSGVSYESPTALERYLELDSAARRQFYYEHFVLPEEYDDYVQREYLAVPESEYLDRIVHSISRRAPESPYPVSTHSLVLAVVDYLSDNYTYTLEPEETESEASALDVFLGETREGYCVQFATAAAMILRRMGVPTRYVEGYIVSGLQYNREQDRLAKYSATVHDYNAHAWIEVYVDGAGWMLYETTPAYYSDLYEVYTTQQGMESDPNEYTPITPSAEIELEDPEEDDAAKIEFNLWIPTVIVLIAAGIGVAVWRIAVIRRKSIRSYEQRVETLDKALRGQLEENELRRIALRVNECIWRLHKTADCMPERGELPSRYALRVDDTINVSLFSFTDVLEYMNREEFGGGMARWELREAAEYASALWDSLWNGMGPFKKFWYRTIRRSL